jgi:hypothetical protein
MFEVSNQLISLASREVIWGEVWVSFEDVSNQLISLASREGVCYYFFFFQLFPTCFQSINFPSE